MTETIDIIDLDHLDHTQFKSWPYSQDFCITCGLCASSCPASGIDGFDPRKLVRMVALGLADEAVAGRYATIGYFDGFVDEWTDTNGKTHRWVQQKEPLQGCQRLVASR